MYETPAAYGLPLMKAVALVFINLCHSSKTLRIESGYSFAIAAFALSS
jgi:hypothetical protein